MLFVLAAAAAAENWRYFDLPAQTWRGLFLNLNDSINLRANYQLMPQFSINSNGSLVMGAGASRMLDTVRTEAIGSLLPPPTPACAERSVRVRYVSEIPAPQNEYGGIGLTHKLVLASDEERDDWPAGLGFTFGTGTIKSLVLFRGYDYGTPVAFAYHHQGNNTCNFETANTCVVFQNTTLPGGRAGVVGNYTIDLEARINVTSALMRWRSLRVHLKNATFDGTIIESSNETLLGTAQVNASRWLATDRTAIRLYLMTRRTITTFRSLVVDVSDECWTSETPTTPPPTSMGSLSTTTTTTTTVVAVESSVGNSTSRAAAEQESTDTAASDDETTFIIFSVVIAVLACALLVVAVVFLVRWHRKRRSKEYSEAGSLSSSDDNHHVGPPSKEYGSLPVRYVKGRGIVRVEEETGGAAAPAPQSFYQKLTVATGGIFAISKKREPAVYDSVLPLGKQSANNYDAVEENEMRKVAFSRDYAMSADVANVDTSSESLGNSAAKQRRAKNHYAAANSPLEF